MPSGTYAVPAGLMFAVPVMAFTRPVTIAYRFRAVVRSVCDAPGKFVVLNIAAAASVEITSNVTDGTRFWL